jgi:hypothetical protein
VVGAADRRAQADHVGRGLRTHIQRRGSRMIAVTDADPADAAVGGLADREIGRDLHRKMTQPVAAIDKRGCRTLAHHPHLGAGGDAATAKPVDILTEPENAVRVVAEEIGLHHQCRNNARIVIGNAERREHIDKERCQLFRRDPDVTRRHRRLTRSRPDCATCRCRRSPFPEHRRPSAIRAACAHSRRRTVCPSRSGRRAPAS